MSAVREIIPAAALQALRALLEQPQFGEWSVEPNADGTFAIVSRDGMDELRYGHFNNRWLAENLAAAENAKTPATAPQCICDHAFPGPAEERHCPACSAAPPVNRADIGLRYSR